MDALSITSTLIFPFSNGNKVFKKVHAEKTVRTDLTEVQEAAASSLKFMGDFPSG